MLARGQIGGVAGAPGALHARWRVPAVELRFRYLGGLAGLIALYYGAAHLGYALHFSGPVAAVVWLPVGVGVAFLYLFGLEFWPGVVAGDLLVNNYMALPVGSALGQTAGNLLEVLVATILLRRLSPRGSPLLSVGGIVGLVVAIAVGTAISATVGSLSLRLGHVVTAGALPRVWRTRWLGDFCGALLVVPLALAWYRPVHPGLWRSRRFEAVVGFAAVIGSSTLVLYANRSLSYLVFPALTWSALRLRLRGATLASAVASGFAIWGVTHYVGPFSFHSLARNVLETQLFIVVASFSTLCLAAVVTEREDFAGKLIASRGRLVGAVDAERLRVQQNIHDGVQQRVTALMIRLGFAEELVRQAPVRAMALIEAAESELDQVVDDLRELAHGRHPRVLVERGLAAAITNLAERSPIPTKLVELPPGRLPETAEATVYYIVAEAVTNVQKHAMASSIRVRVQTTHDIAVVEVVDDGVGGAVEREGSGLQGLRDRVEALGGRFEVDTVVGHGTRVAATVPTTPIRG